MKALLIHKGFVVFNTKQREIMVNCRSASGARGLISAYRWNNCVVGRATIRVVPVRGGKAKVKR